MKKSFILKNNKLLIAICSMLLILVAVVASIFLFTEISKSSNNGEDNISSVNSYPGIISYFSNDEELNLTNENKTNKLFYVKDNNIFTYDLSLEQEEGLTNYPKNKDYSPAYDEGGNQLPNISISNIKPIDEQTLGYSLCAVVSGDYGCSINTLDLISKNIIQKVRLNKNSNIIDVGFSNANSFAYTYIYTNQETNTSSWRFTLNHIGIEKELFTMQINAYGRGGHSEDSQLISYSRDMNFLLQIDTASPVAAFDDNIYLYDLKHNTKRSIPKATQPSWLNDTQIIYKGFDAKLNIALGLYIYDTVSKESNKVIDIPDTAGFPNVLSNNRIVYKDKGDIWLHDFNTNESKKLLISATVFSVINDVKFSYVDVIPCNGKENCGGLMGNFEYGKEKVFDIQKMESKDLNI